MPSMKICRCGKLIDLNLKMCTECEMQRWSAAERGYDSSWRRYRNIFLREHPLCEECLKEGKITPATIVDHIKPHK